MKGAQVLRMPVRRRRHRTLLEIPSDHLPRSQTTMIGHASLLEPEVEPLLAPSSAAPKAAAPWTEEVFVSPSGRIFLPPDFDFDRGLPRTVTRRSVRREPTPARPKPRRAHVVLGRLPTRPRVETRESWVVPQGLAPA